MRFKPIGFFLILIFVSIFCIELSCCKKNRGQKIKPKTESELKSENAIFQTWQENEIIFKTKLDIPIENQIPKNARPFAGVVSHHLLAYQFIDEWFSTLAEQNPKIKTFIILSPSHWNLSNSDFSLTFGSWNFEGEKILTDSKIEKQLLEKLDGKIEDEVFRYEHGVSTLTPFISKYFSNAKIAAVAYLGESERTTYLSKKLSDAIKPFVAKDDVFILISSDFSHHGDEEKTKANDTVSRKFFDFKIEDDLQFPRCDNRPAFYALKNTMPKTTKSIIQRNTNSFIISGIDENDITSYFFAYFCTQSQ